MDLNHEHNAAIAELYKQLSAESANKHHPWKRFFARSVDLFTGAALILYILVSSHFVDAELFGGFLGWVFAYIFWVPVEAAFISWFGATPAKWLFGIKVLNKDSGKLTYEKAFTRTKNLLERGEGFGIPLVFLVTRGIAYWDLKKKGTTWWDFNNGSEVSYVQWGFVRGLACAMVIVLLAAVYLAAYWQYLFP